MLQVAHLAQRRHAAHVDAPQLARRHAHRRVVALLGQQLRCRSSGPHQLPTAAQGELDVVHGRAEGNPVQRQRVAHPHRGVGPAHDLVADLETERGQDVALLPVAVVDEGDSRGSVGVVLDGGHLAGHAELVAPEVDPPIRAAAVAAAMAGRDLALVVAAGVVLQRLEQASLGLRGGDLLEAGRRHEAAARAGRLVLPDWHRLLPTGSRTGLPASGPHRG